MKQTILLAVILIGAVLRPAFGEPQIHVVEQFYTALSKSAIHTDRLGTLWYGGPGSVFKIDESGKKKKALMLESSHSRVNSIISGPTDKDELYIGTSEGLYKGSITGKRFEKIYSALDHHIGSVEDIIIFNQSLYVTTQAGIFVMKNQKDWSSLTGIPQNEPYSMKCNLKANLCLIMGRKNVYQFNGRHAQWIGKSSNSLTEDSEGETEHAVDGGNSQLGVETTLLSVPKLYFHQSKYYRIHGGQFQISSDQGLTWVDKFVVEQSHETPPIMGVHEQSNFLMIPVHRGILVYDVVSEQKSLIGLSWKGAPRAVEYDAQHERLILADDWQIYRMDYPNLNIHSKGGAQSRLDFISKIQDRFMHEPTILALQNKAMLYGEVHPDKIQRWRKSIKKKGWVPDLSLHFDQGLDETVELDRGGTNDPDQFIIGPQESDFQWGVDLSWDLSEIIWTDEELAVDNRSKLMVQLRDDILNELNQLYFSRREAQITQLLKPHMAIDDQIELQLRIDRYTAGIDALTGGYLTATLDALDHSSDESLIVAENAF